jgi:hypothetical protein
MKYILLMVAALILSVNPTFAIDPGFAKGYLKIDGETITLTHAYAMQNENEEGVLEQAELRILLTDREVSQTLLSGPFLESLQSLARKGGVRGVLLKLDARKLLKAPVYGTLLVAPKNPQESFLFFTISSEDGSFEKLEQANNRVVGKTHYQFKMENSFEYDVSLSAPLFRDEVTARLTGAQALNSPHIQALLAYEGALRNGDLETVRGLSTPERYEQVKAYRAHIGEKDFPKQVKSEIPGPEKRKKQIREVIVRGSRAFVVLQEADGKTVQILIQVDGTWKIE